jgi:6-phosphogluconolactonase
MTALNNVNFLSFVELEEQSQHLAQTVADSLQQKINIKHCATLAVSGGSTPKRLFEILSEIDIQWQKVTISLVDDRWLSPRHEDSNQRLVEQNLLQNKANKANFISFFQPDTNAFDAISAINTKFSGYRPDVILLGMGNDGHTASLFPCSQQITEGLSTKETYLAVEPTTAAYTRVSLSANTISGAEHIFLQLKGDDKKATLQNALSGQDEKSMPIRRFLKSNITVLWCP